MSERNLRRSLVVIAVVQVVVSLYYALTHAECVADESVHMQDVLRYYFVGINFDTIRAHANPAAPGPYLWTAVGAKVFGMTWPGLRLTLFAAWALVCAVFYAMYRAGVKDVVVPALLFTAFIYFPICVGKWMTEMPGFFFLFAALYFLERAGRREDDWAALVGCSLSLGLALFCKQFFLAAVPAMMLAHFLRTRRIVASAVIGIGPALSLAFLFALWHGITSPFSREVDPNHAAVGLNWVRAWNSAMYCGLYAIAGLPWTRRDIFNAKHWGIFLGLGVVVTALLAGKIDATWQLGPILSALLHLEAHAPGLARVVSFISASVATALFEFFLLTIARERRAIQANALELFAAFFCVLFVAENLGAGGGIPFYERYIYNLIFFIYFLLIRRGTADRRLIFVAALLWLGVGQASLWANHTTLVGFSCSLQWPLAPQLDGYLRN